ncbi:hypothetical protein ZOSMA_105G00100 [Zostera marina]|uniref:Uncharacterized protein n=1 Tax=Zostera marina TaxID=29655 RepID=A0A0K9Q4J1_ZOSMR|nr:hypothetical protein ZOSMA_105G00100 [Zostera marina]
MWALNQAYHWQLMELLGMDVFICTEDLYKEPPIGVVNTALSVMAYDYPMEK